MTNGYKKLDEREREREGEREREKERATKKLIRNYALICVCFP